MKHKNNLRFIVLEENNILKYGETHVKDLEFGIQKLLSAFPDGTFSEMMIRDNLKKYNLENMLTQIQQYFDREYHFHDASLELNNSYQRRIGSYVWKDQQSAQGFIHIDELYESALLSFLLTMLKWAKEFNDPDVYGFGFIHALYTLNDVSILGHMPDENATETLLAMIRNDLQIINLAEDCYWTITAFNIAHEIAHAYLGDGHIRNIQSRKKSHQEEFSADAIAYDIVLKMIIDGKSRDRNDAILEEYTYLAPMIFIDYIDLIYYTDYVLYQSHITTERHPPLKKRKNHLFAISNKEKYDFDTTEGNTLYNGFLDVYIEYKTQLLIKKERGKLDRIIRPERFDK